MHPALRVLALVLLTGSLSAGAERKPRANSRAVVVTLALDEDSGSEAATLEKALAAEAAKRGEVADPLAALAPERVEFRDKAVRMARLALVSARGFFDQNEMTAARGEVARAVELFEQGDLAQPLDDLLIALTYRAAIRAYDLDSAGSTLDLRRVAILGGETADPEIFSEDVVADSERARAWVARAPRGTLNVRTSPVQARVYLDGKVVGTSPVRIEGIPTGEHYVAVRAIGYEPAQSKVTVGVSADVELPLDPIPTPAAENARWAMQVFASAVGSDDRRLAEAAGRLALALDVDEVIVATAARSWSNAELKGVRIRRDETIVGRAEYAGPRDGLDETIRELARGLYRPLGAAFPGRPGKSKGEEPGAVSVFFSRPRNYVLLGALGLAAGWGIAAFRAYDANRELRKTPQVEPSVEELIHVAQGRAVLADVLLGGTLVVGGVYGLMFYLDERGEKKFSLRRDF